MIVSADPMITAPLELSDLGIALFARAILSKYQIMLSLNMALRTVDQQDVYSGR